MYDVIFVGSGHAAWHGAMTLAKSGKKVALVEANKVAGTCTNYGCNAKILLDGPAEIIHHLNHYHGIGINETPSIVWPELMNYKHTVIDPLSDGLANMLSVNDVEIIAGHASFVDENTIKVGPVSYKADKFVIATGQKPAKLPIDGSEFTHDSTDFLDLPEMPKSMVFIGAGYIAMEFAAIAHAAGSKVTLIEYGSSALRGFDSKYSANVVKEMQNRGIEFAFDNAVKSVKKVDDGYVVTTQQGNEFKADYVMDTTGRRANIDNLGLDNIGVKYDKQGVLVNDTLQTNVKNIYASGDVISKQIPRLTPTATFESNYVASVLLGNKTPIKYPVVPTVAFTLPRIAQIGMLPDDAVGDEYSVHEIPYGKMMEFQAQHDVNATLKVVVKDHKLVGASLLGDFAPELVNALVPVINDEYDAAKIVNTIYAFPTHTGTIMPLIARTLV